MKGVLLKIVTTATCPYCEYDSTFELESDENSDNIGIEPMLVKCVNPFEKCGRYFVINFFGYVKVDTACVGESGSVISSTYISSFDKQFISQRKVVSYKGHNSSA